LDSNLGSRFHCLWKHKSENYTQCARILWIRPILMCQQQKADTPNAKINRAMRSEKHFSGLSPTMRLAANEIQGQQGRIFFVAVRAVFSGINQTRGAPPLAIHGPKVKIDAASHIKGIKGKVNTPAKCKSIEYTFVAN